MKGTVYRGNSLCGALFSPCGHYRYALWRVWDSGGESLAWIGLNPSTADEQKDDPTIRRILDFSKRWGYKGAVMLNLFAFRATHPEVMMDALDPAGPENNNVIANFCDVSTVVIACWGNLGSFQGRDICVRPLIKPQSKLRCLKLTEQGQPWHPLYVKKTTTPKPFPAMKES